MSPLEIAANAVITLSIWLAARNSVHTWSTGVLGCALFGVLFFQAKLYADATLQLFFIVTSAIGWFQWRQPAGREANAARPITRTAPGTLLWMAGAGLFVTFAYGGLLYRFTDAYLPYIDAAVLALSVIAQCLLMQRKLETWPVWLTVNSLSVPLFFSRGLLLTAALYTAYWLNAWYGWWRWRREQLSQSAATELV
jgi:nicotinamide mononucleotide transporter